MVEAVTEDSARGDRTLDAFEALSDRCLSDSYRLAAVVLRDPTEAQDVVQETVISVSKDIQKFKRDRALGSFKGWLRNLTRWRIADQLRKRTRSVPFGDDRSDSSSVPVEIGGPVNAELEAVWEEDWQANLLEAAMERVKPRVKEEHYQMFDLNVVRQWPASKVAQTLGVNIGRVYLAKYRIMALIKKEIRVLEKQW